jgi:hypothetical protein
VTTTFDQQVARLRAVTKQRILLSTTAHVQTGAGQAPTHKTAKDLALEAMLAYVPPIATEAPPEENNKKNSSWYTPKRNWLMAIPVLGSYLMSATSPDDKTVGRRAVDLLSRPLYASASAANTLKTDDSAVDAALEGFKGKSKMSYSQVLQNKNPAIGDKQAAALGFILDMNLDPANLVGSSPLKGAKRVTESIRGIEGTKDVGEAVQSFSVVPKRYEGTSPVDATLKTGTQRVTPGPQSELNSTGRELGTSVPRLALEGKSPNTFVAGSTGTYRLADAHKFVDTMNADTIASSLTGVPSYLRPQGIIIDPPWKTVTEPVKTTVPKTVESTVVENVPVATTEAQASKLAELRATKMAIMQHPQLEINVSGTKYRVDSLLATAKLGKEEAAKVNKIFDAEAKRRYLVKDTSDMPEIMPLQGKQDGRMPVAGLTVSQAAQLLKEGKIAREGDSTLPLYSQADLHTVYLNNSKGQKVSIQQYMTDLGIAPRQVDDAFIFGHTTKPVTKTVSKTVYEEVTSGTKTVEKRLVQGEALRWAMKYSHILSSEDIKYLRNAKTRASFDKRLIELNTKTVVKDFATLDDLIQAAENGLIPQASINKILQITGTASLKELKAKATSILNKVGEVKVNSPRIVSKDVSKPDTPKTTKVERTKTITPSPWDTVVPADKLIEKVAEGDLAAIAKSTPEISANILKDVAEVLPATVIKELVTPQMLDKYPFLTTIKQTKRTHSQMGEGLGRNLHGWNAKSQYTMWKAFLRRSSARNLVPKNLTRAQKSAAYRLRTDVMYTEVINALRLSEAALKSKGVRFIAGVDESGTNISLLDVLESLPKENVKKYFFNPPGSSLPSISPESALQIADITVKIKTGSANPKIASQAIRSIIEHDPGISKFKDAKAKATAVHKMFDDAAPELMRRVQINYAQDSIKMGESVKSMSDEVINRVIEAYANPDVSVADALTELMDRSKGLAVKATKSGAPDPAVAVTKDLVDARLAESIPPGDFAEAALTKKITEVPKAEVPKEAVKQQESRATEAMTILSPDEVVDLGDVYGAQIINGIYRSNSPLLDKAFKAVDVMGRTFVPAYGQEYLHKALLNEVNHAQSIATVHRNLMQGTFRLAKDNAGPDASRFIQEAFRNVQQGVKATDPVLQQVQGAMENSIGMLFGGLSESSRAGMATRNGLFTAHINKTLDYFGVHPKYRFETDNSLVDQANGWRAWEDVKDPLDLLDKVHAAVQKSATEATLGRSFSHNFGISEVKPGYVKLVDNAGTNPLFDFLDKSLYYPKDVAKQFANMGKFINDSSTGLGKGNIANIVRKYDSILHAFKAGLTIYRPGHHVRNMVGDLSLAYMAGVTNPNVYRKAIKVMSTRSKMYNDWDGLKALHEGISKSDGQEFTAKVITNINGKRVALDDDRLWRLAFDKGLLPDYRTLEDISINNLQDFGRFAGWTKPFGGNVQKVAANISQSRDHFVRMAHFIDILQKGKYSNVDEAASIAAAEVRKWHPDGSDLTRTERMVMRRSILFYSWMRKAIPLVVEASVKRPGRVLAVPKAMYALAVANGIDPESLGDPFPEDGLYPSFIKDNILGPQWKGQLGDIPGMGVLDSRQYGMNPGDPFSDIMGSYGGENPQNTLAGGLTPVARIPLELLTGQQLGTGTSIKDKTDYVDSQIPGVNYLSNVSNRSVSSGFTQPQRDVAKGYSPDGIDSQALMNMLTGLGVRDYTKPNYTTIAEKELLDKLIKGYNGGG